MRTRIVFDQISVSATKRWKDPVTGKSRQQTRKFMQTFNPFNRTGDGAVKSRAQIYTEIKQERDAWLKEPHP